MNYSDFVINIKSNILGLTEAFIMILGEEYRELVTQNLNNLLLISFIVPNHLKSYLERNNLNLLDSEDLLKDERTEEIIKTKYYQKYIKKLVELFPNNSIFTSELNKTINNNYYKSPLINVLLSNNDAITKFMILEKLGYHIDIKKPYALYKEKNDSKVNEYWNKIFTIEETKILGTLSKEIFVEMEYEIVLNTGTIRNNQLFFEQQELLIGKAFDYKEIAEYHKARYVAPDISLKTNEVTPVLVFCPLFDVNEYTLLSFIHELTHAIAMNCLSNANRIKLKLGLTYMEFSRGINIYNNEECKKDNAIYDEESILFNETITQYIATLVTQVILDNHLCDSLFSFNLPPQKASFEASYPNLMITFGEFIASNFNEIKESYLGTVLTKSIGNINCKYLNEFASKVKNNSSSIEEIKNQISSNKVI